MIMKTNGRKRRDNRKECNNKNCQQIFWNLEKR